MEEFILVDIVLYLLGRFGTDAEGDQRRREGPKTQISNVSYCHLGACMTHEGRGVSTLGRAGGTTVFGGRDSRPLLESSAMVGVGGQKVKSRYRVESSSRVKIEDG